MPPKFNREGFMFEPGEEVPEHINDYPREEERDRSKWYLEGYDTFDGEYYPLAIDIDTKEVAEMLRKARLRDLERTQPAASSGGQGTFGIQDRVFIVPPEKFNISQGNGN